MTRECPTRAMATLPRVGTPSEEERRLYTLFTALAGPSGVCHADLDEIGRLLRIRPLALRIALLGLRMRGKVSITHSPDRFEAITVTLAPQEVSR